MNRKISLPLEVNEHTHETGIQLTIPWDLVAAVCLELALLRFGLSRTLSVTTKGSGHCLTVSLVREGKTGGKKKVGGRGSVTWTASGAEVALGGDLLDGWLGYSLAYFMDGIAPGHIDIQVPAAGGAPGKDLFLTVQAELSAPLRPGEELLKEWGMDRPTGGDRRG